MNRFQEAAFDESSRPVATVDFENSVEARERAALTAEIRPALIAQIGKQTLQTVRAYLRYEYEWAAQGRTLRARMIRLALLKGDENTAQVARRFKVGQHAVRKHSRQLVKLRAHLLVEVK